MSESRETELIEAIIENLDDSETEYTKTPQSRNEEILVSILNETEYTKTPQSREEELLLELKEKIGGLVPPVPPVIKRVTGNPIEFEDGADAPLVKCVTAITGSQDLHGQDKPWVGGAGKNKLPLVLSDIKSIQSPATSQGSWSGDSYITNGVTFKINTDNGGNVISILATGSATSDNATLVLYGTNVTSEKDIVFSQPFIVSDGAIGSASTFRGIVWGTEGAFIDGEEVSFNAMTVYGFGIRILAGYTLPSGGVMFYPMIRLSTETDPTFAPYSNICPITAYTEGKIEVRGKNIFDIDATHTSYAGVTYQYDVSGLKPNTSYTLSTNDDIGSASLSNLYINGTSSATNGVFKSRPATVNSGAQGTMTIYVRYSGGNIDLYTAVKNGTYYIQLEEGSTATDYEPYKGTAHTTTYPSAIYRGSEDVVNGEVTEEWRVVDLGDFNYVLATNFQADTPLTGTGSGYTDCICEQYIMHNVAGSSMVMGDIKIQDRFLQICDTRYNDATAFKSAVTGIKLVYKLATPTTSSVTPTNPPIKSLSGYNHIESSTGEMTIDYITDAYQNFVDTVESALPNTTRKGVLLSTRMNEVTAMDIFLSLDNPKTPGQEKVDEIQNGVKEETIDDRR